jgi:hypothetical protein
VLKAARSENRDSKAEKNNEGFQRFWNPSFDLLVIYSRRLPCRRRFASSKQRAVNLPGANPEKKPGK